MKKEKSSERGCIDKARTLLGEGQFFLALDFLKSVKTLFPKSIRLQQFEARSLIKIGALQEAREILEKLCRRTHRNMELEEESFGNLGAVYKEIWKTSGLESDAKKSRDIYLNAFRKTGRYWTGINAAVMSWIIDDYKTVGALARKVYALCKKEVSRKPKKGGDENLFWALATMADAAMLLGDGQEAIDIYKQAVKLYKKSAPCNRKHHQIITSLQQLKLLKSNGFDVPEELFNILSSPPVLVFTGHMIDGADRKEPRFPANAKLEKAVAKEIEKYLDDADIHIGYTGAACGADLLFIEAMHKRKAEVNIFLPFNKDDYLNTSVSFAGQKWVNRFKEALKKAKSVTYVTEERFLGDDVLFDFAGKIFYGAASLRARMLETTPHMLAVLDEKSPPVVGGTTDTIGQWPNENKKAYIEIGKLRDEIGTIETIKTGKPVSLSTAPAIPGAQNDCSRVIRSMLFADVVGYSKLQDEHMPFFMYEFLGKIAEKLNRFRKKPIMVNTWGDAIFTVLDSAVDMAEYSLCLLNAISAKDWEDTDDGQEMGIRIALHAGPVFEGVDPITGRKNFYGAHVNRVARLEPVSMPGYIYATEQFAGLLEMEQAGSDPQFISQYVGNMSLAKKFGDQHVYRILKSKS